MALFGRKSKNPDEGLPTLEESPVDLSGVRLDSLLMSSGGSYENKVHPDHIAKSLAVIRQHFRGYRYPEWWEGTAYLVPGSNDGHQVIWVRALGHNVDKLTAECLERVDPLISAPTPVLCSLTIIGDGHYERPSVSISVPRRKKAKAQKSAPPPVDLSQLPPPPT